MCSIWFYKYKKPSASISPSLHFPTRCLTLWWQSVSEAESTLKPFLADYFPTVFPRSVYYISDSYTSSLPLHLFYILHSHSTLLAKYATVGVRLWYVVMKSETHCVLLKPWKSLWKQRELTHKAWRCIRLKPLKLDSIMTLLLLYIFNMLCDEQLSTANMVCVSGAV